MYMYIHVYVNITIYMMNPHHTGQGIHVSSLKYIVWCNRYISNYNPPTHLKIKIF